MQNKSSKPRVLLVFGGASGEHGVSCATAAGVYTAIDHERYEVTTVGITRDGHWVPVDFNPEAYRLKASGTAEVPDSSHEVSFSPGGDGMIAYEKTPGGVADARFFGQFDVVFPLLHGPFGEDGTIQGLLEMAGVRYVGCGVLSSAVSMEKHVTKVLLKSAGVPVGEWRQIRAEKWKRAPQQVLATLSELAFPLFVKPCRAGSSLGVSRVENTAEISSALETAFSYDPSVIVEEAHRGLEVECAVLQGRDGGAPRTTQPGCIKMSDEIEFYDYETKYLGRGTVDLQIPAEIPVELAIQVRELASVAFETLQCEGLTRVDFFVDVETGRIILNEVNTMPGFTPFSMFPALWQAEGMSYACLVDELLQLALERPLGLR